ncbi:MAG: peroxiredoxin family protein [Verrucomicrobiota bacterium]
MRIHLQKPQQWTVFALTVALGVGTGWGQGYRNFNLTCLAPLLEQIDSETPATFEVAFLRGPTRSPDLRSNLGEIDFPISSSSSEAQAFFDQGMALLFGLDYREAERNFRQALDYHPEHPMILWGLALANEQIPGRARLFAHRAITQINNETRDQERLWIQTTARYFEVRSDGPDKLPPPPQVDPEQKQERIRRRIQDIEEIVLRWPEDVNAKALLLRQLTLDKYRNGTPVTSHVAVATLAQEIAARAPTHPSRHYQIFLWLEERPAYSLSPAKESPALASGIPNSWRYAAEAQKANGLNHTAVPLLEAALRVSHSHLQEHLLMPTEIDGLASNYAALVETLSSMGQIKESIGWARRMIEMPRDLNASVSLTSSLHEQGKKLWVEARLGAEMTEELMRELDSNPALLPLGEEPLENAQWLYWKAITLMLQQRFEESIELGNTIQSWSNRATSAASQQIISDMLEALSSWQRLVSGDQAVPEETPPPQIPPWIWAKEMHRLGYPNRSMELARRTIDERPGQWLPTAALCELSHQTGEVVPAMTAFNRQFRMDASRVDPEVPAMKGLEALALQMKLPRRWQIVKSHASDSAGGTEPPGPRYWEAAKAPDFSLADHTNEKYSLASFEGEAVLIQFVLGVTCPFCTKQLDAFRQHAAAYEDANISTAIVTSDSAETLEQLFGDAPDLIARYPYPIMADPTLKTFKAYGVYDDFEEGGMHGTFLISPDGHILWRNVSHSTFEKPRQLLDEAKRLLANRDVASM